MKMGILASNGRMGQQLCAAVQQQGHQLFAYVRSDSDLLNNLQGVAYRPEIAVPEDNLDVIIDFALSTAIDNHLTLAQAANVPLVLGSTGLTEAQWLQVQAAARHIPILYSANFSVGIAILKQTLAQVAPLLDEEWDIDIIEAHHRFKIDAPSGTALALGEAIASSKGWQLDQVAVMDRMAEGHLGHEPQIAFASIRSADIVGEHSVFFAQSGERLEFTHKASSRMVFAKGAVKAAAWLKNQPPRLYNLENWLGFS